jgi:hypothetical protein
MNSRHFALVGTPVAALLVALLLALVGADPANTTVAANGASLRTPWGEPDLQGIWNDQFQTPLQRPAKYAGRELLTDEEVAALDEQRAAIPQRPRVRPGKGSEADVAGAYNGVFVSVRPTSRRTSLIVDPPDGRMPPFTPEVQKRRAEIREYQLALLQATQQCKNKERSCAGWTYGPPSPRRDERPPHYMTANINRADGPEDRSLGERCMAAQLPDFGGFRRIVQSRGSVSIFYDVGQGQGWQRVIPITNTPHLPSNVRQWWGDSRGRWEGNTLVVDVTNFSGKTDYQGSRENLHLVERWTRIDADTLEYSATIDDSATWTKPWTVKQELVRQNDRANRIYYEPRCHEGNYGLTGVLTGARAVERAFSQGKGPHPAAVDIFSTGPTFFAEEDIDPLAGGGAG